MHDPLSVDGLERALGGDPVALCRALVATDSVNPVLAPGGSGERGVAELVAGWLDAWGLAPNLSEIAPGRFNVVGTLEGEGPTLLLNGGNDEEHPWISRALPLWNLLREPKELVLVEGGGHVPSIEDRIPPINDFLDRTLGRVNTR